MIEKLKEFHVTIQGTDGPYTIDTAAMNQLNEAVREANLVGSEAVVITGETVLGLQIMIANLLGHMSQQKTEVDELRRRINNVQSKEMIEFTPARKEKKRWLIV